MRSYRDSTWNKRDDPTDTFILGPAQLAWLKREVAASDATWKVIAADLPIGLISEDAIALGNGPPQRREHEIADLLSFDASLKKLRLDHVDLYLVHWPSRNMNLPAIFETLLKLKQEGHTRAIGVANFNLALLKTAVEGIKAPIACNQIEYHVMLDQTKVARYLAAKSIPLVAYAPLAQGRAASDETLISIGRKHGASAAQVALKWLLDQDGVAAIPKASRAESQRANLDALKLKLDDEDRKAIAALPKD